MIAGKFWWCGDRARNAVVAFWCPGCDELHQVPVLPASGGWRCDGPDHAPTLAPSLLVRGRRRCHLFVRAGRLEFLADCEHDARSSTRDPADLPDWAWD